MHPSRRSSRSAHTPRRPAWRAPSAGKNSATASVSLVFAEPEHGAPLTPASHAIVSTQLDIHSSDNVSISSRNVTPKPSITSLRMFRRDIDEPENAVASGSGVQSTGLPDPSPGSTPPEVPQNTESRPSTALATPATDHSVATAPSTVTNHSTSSLPLYTTPPVSPSKKSWFGTLSRTRGGKSPSKLNIVQTVHNPQPGQDAPALSVINLSQDDCSSTSLRVTKAGPAAEAERPIQAAPSSPRPVASSAPATLGPSVPSSPIPVPPIPPQPIGTAQVTSHSPSPPPIMPVSPRSVPKSGSMSPPASITKAKESSSPPIGEEIPVVDLTTELPLPPSVAVPPNNGNASSSRFTLSIPFLGRSKGASEGAERMDNKDPISTQSSGIKDTDSSIPQPITVELFADAAGDSLQNAIAHSSEPPSIPAAEMETSKDQGTEHSRSQSSADTAAEKQASPIAHPPPDATWWAYLGWSAAPAPSNPAPSTSPHGTAAMSPPPSVESALRQSDSRSETAATNPDPLLSTAQASDAISGISPTTQTAPSNAPADSQKATGHASEMAEGSPVVQTQLAISNRNDVYKAPELEPLPRSLALQDRSSGEARPQQLGSAEQAGAAASSPEGLAGPSWFSPWAWYSQPSSQVAVGPSDGGENNAERGMEKAGGPGPAGVAVAERECALRDDGGRKRAGGMEASDGGHQSVVGVGVDVDASVGGGAVEEQSLEVSKRDQRADADNGVAGVTVPSDQVANPIEQSITAYRSGWASFFSSRRLMVKTLGYGSARPGELGDVKRDENGMEIMEVDFDEDAISADGSLSNDQKPNLEDGVVKVNNEDTSEKGVKAAVGSSTGVSSTSAKTSQDGVAKPSPQPSAPPPTTADDIKATVQSNAASDRKGKSAPTSKPGSGPTTPILRPSTPTGKAVPLPSSPSAAAPPARNTRDRKRTASPAPSSKKGPPPPNLVLPTWEDTFHVPPRSVIPPSAAISQGQGDDRLTSGKLLGRAMGFVSSVLFSKDGTAAGPGSTLAAGNKARLGSGGSGVGEDHQEEQLSAAEKERREKFLHFGMELPRALDLIEPPVEDLVTSRSGMSCSPHKTTGQAIRQVAERFMAMDVDKDKEGVLGPGERARVRDVFRGCRRVVVIGVHGWFPGAVVRTVLGEPTGTSGKFVDMMVQALENFQGEHSVSLDKITRIPLEGEGTIERRVEKLYSNLIANFEWMDDIHAADAIFVATHSQGSVVSTHLLNRLISDGHIHTSEDSQAPTPVAASIPAAAGMPTAPASKPQRVCCLALCGIHLGPLRYLSSSTFFQPYLQYFESSAARELFEFQNTDSAVSKSYVSALRHVLNNGVKMVYVASLNDQVVPIYSGLFTAVSHPLILRALYIDGDAYHSSDFLSKLLVLLLRILNSGISDSGLLAHLSEATAGSLNGVGHSTAYEEIATYALAVKYLFSTSDGLADHAEATLESFNAGHEQNDYEIPWALRDVIADERVTHFFAREIAELRDAFRDWHPKTTILRDLKRKLQPIQRLPSTFSSQGSTSKL